MVKKTELHQDVDMFQKNSLKKTTLQRSKHLSPTHFYIYIYTSFLNTLQVTLDHGGILPRSPGHSVTTKSHLWGDTICPASAPKHFGCRWRSPRHNGPRCFCREGFLVAKKSYQMTAWYQNTPEELKNPTRFWFVRLVRFQDCVPPIKKNKKKTRSCQLEQLQSRHGKRNHPLLTLEVIHRIHSWSSIHVRYIHLLFHMISPCRKETTIHWNKTILLQQETCQRNKHAFNLKSSVQKSDESIWIYTYLYHSSYIFFPPPPLLIRFLCPYPCCHWKSPHLTSGGLEPSAAARRTTLLDQSWWPQGRLEANLCKAWQGSKALPWQRCWSSGNLSKGHVLTYDTSL